MAFIVVGAPWVLHVEDVGRAEEGSPDAPERKGDELGVGEKHEVDFFPLDEPGAGPEEVEPATKAQITHTEEPGPAERQGGHADEADVGWNGLLQFGFENAVLRCGADTEDDRLPPVGAIIR